MADGPAGVSAEKFSGSRWDGATDRLTRTAVGRGRLIMALWAALVVASCAFAFMRPESFGAPALTVPGSESQRAAALVARGMPGLGTEQMMLAFTSSSLRVEDEAYQRAMAATVRELDEEPGAGEVVPLPGETRPGSRHAYLLLGMPGGQGERQAALPRVADAARHAAESASRGRVTVSLTGVTPVFTELARSDLRELRTIECFTVPVAALVLAVGMGSLGAALVPLLVAGAGIAVSVGTLAVLGPVRPVDTVMLAVATTVGLGLGLDYALLILMRYRQSRERGEPPGEAMARAMATAGRSVLWCGAAVLVTASALLTVPVPVARGIGLTALITTLVTLAGALTLLPAVLPRLDPWLDAGSLRRRTSRGAGSLWVRWAHHLMRRPWPYLLGVTTALLLATAPVAGLRLGMHVDRGSVAASDTGRGLARMEADGIAGVTLIALPHPPEDGPVDTEALLDALRADPRVALVTAMDNGKDLTLVEVGERFPADSATAAALARHIRAAAPGLLPDRQPVLTGGPAATLTDLRSSVVAAVWRVAAIVLAGTFLLLLVLFRSLLIPLKAIAMNLLTVGAALGLLGLTAGHLGGNGEVNVIVPLLAVTIVFGLSMDYEVFLVHRIAEHYRSGGDNRAAVAHGLRHTARPVTLAAAVMSVVFLGLMASGRSELRQEGFAVAVAVFLDATVVRMVLVPSLMRLLGHRNWWLPPPLARVLPPVSPRGTGVPAPRERAPATGVRDRTAAP
ncbi:MMPL family transporter [Streptomyces sp. LP05-1]|uniref:MMPL family transporter n=1 Tax=Streptomyces pyxinae TaxID=2970734 RepID=A0ABT2CK09_9ACTN|nr:MMPL family transporter [Streptomyces sp. LP05-1]MCS0637051.1 MMPL family transporter [Streptomyces sp. LP05-1]